MPDEFELPRLTPLELNRIAPMKECSWLSSLSEDALEDNYADLIISLSPKRKGMRVGDALMIRKSRK
jgi:hypothetical protein